MIVFKEKLYFAPIAAMGGWGNVGLMGGTTALSMGQAHFQGKDAEKQAEESQRLQKKMNKELARIADSGDPAKGQQAAAILQGQTFSDVADDVGEDLGNGIKKAGNAIGGAAGTVTGAAVGSVLGAGVGMAGAGLYNKYAVGDAAKNATKGATTATANAAKGATTTAAKGAATSINRVGIWKGAKYGTIAGLIGGSILGGQSGSSLFSQKSFAAGSELANLGKGLWKVAGQHKGTIAENLAAGVVMGGTGYAANKMIKSDEENGTNNSLGKIAALGTGLVLGGMALKKGANWGAFGKDGARYARRAGDALKTGGGFGAVLAGIPAITKSQQQQNMVDDTGNGEQKKKSGMGTATKVLLGTGLALGAAKGGHMAAKAGWFGKPGRRLANDISKKIETTKDSIVRNIGGDNIAKNRQIYNETQKTLKETPKYKNPEFKDSPGEYILDKVTAGLAGGGTQRTQKLADQLKATDSSTLQKVGDFMKDPKHRKAALLVAAVPGYVATMDMWQKGEDATSGILKKFDPKAFEEDNDNI